MKRLISKLCAISLMCLMATPSMAWPMTTAQDAARLDLDYDAFDASGWRDLLANGQTDAAVAQLEQYRSANETRLTPYQVRELHFHVGQALAMSGRDAESIPHFEAARGGGEEWSAYVDATLAFLRRDTLGLSAERARYAQAPNASDMRLSFIDGFIACPRETYMRAVHCAMTSPH